MLLLIIISALVRSAFAASASPSYANSTTPKATLSSASISCAANCTASANNAFWAWVPQPVGTTITAATIIYVVNNATNTTSTITKYNSLPDGYTLPPTNSAGSQTAVITPEIEIGESTVITLTFPTGMVQDPVDYTWAGTLPTIGPMGQSVCSTGSAVIPYPSGTFTTTSVASPTSADDPGGLLWTLVTDGCVVAPDPTRVPNDAAPKLCSLFGICPANVKTTASFLTETSTSHINSAPAGSPAPAQPAKSSPGNSNPGSAIVSAAVGAALKAASSNPSAAAGSGSGSGSNPGSNSGGSNSGSSGSGSSNSGSSQGQGTSNNNGAAPAASPHGQTQATPAPVVVGDSTLSASVGAGGSTIYNVGGQTLALGSTVVLGSGPSATTIAFQASAGNAQVVVNGKTSALPATAGTPAAVVVGGSTVTPSVAAGGNTVLNVGGSTVALGSTITIGSGSSATTIAYQVSGGQTQVVVNGQTSTLPSSTAGGVGNAIMSGLGNVGGNGSATTSPVMFTGSAERIRGGSAVGIIVQVVWLLLFWR